MTFTFGRLLPLDDREPRPDAATNPSMAQHHLWLAQAQFDHRNIGVNELSKIEGKLAMNARQSRTIFNPFTGEVRRLDANGEVSEPVSYFLGGIK